ncbi:zinc finger protein VAR3, chloroplastic [Impatiens glandulifera]|uniref:zinc finger protein VAR3, chloroplastic n=1 Tax=Impatiens glandulifera TaxID=253017 RepID=UPI001FB09D8D|nr:zinc finger protein VAR3, chloroplastic [Impatiens glandulifera]
MGGASRFIMLLATTPVPHFHPRPCLLRLARHSRFSLSSSPLTLSLHFLSISPVFIPQYVIPSKSSRHIHIRNSAVRDEDSAGQFPNSFVSHPWPEWSKFIDVLSSAGYFNQQGHGIQEEDSFVAYADLSEDFVRIVTASFDYSRRQPQLLCSLSRRDMVVVVNNGTPFLFRSSLESSRRMKSFLGLTGNPGLEHEEAQMIDLMKYLLSYASKPTVSSNGIHMHIGDNIESSVRSLLNELIRLSSGMEASHFSSFKQHQVPDSYPQKQRSLGPKIEMKRGDWICSRCSFMNFARNNKCLECEEARPMRQLTGGEWACPKCDFYNYGRNVTCLRCDCKRPGEAPFRSANEYPKGGSNNSHNTFVPFPTDMFAKKSTNLSENCEKATTEILGTVDGYDVPQKPLNDQKEEQAEKKSESWLKRLEELHDVSTTDSTDDIPEENFPDIMPMRKGENRFVVSKRKDRSLVSPMYKRKMATEQSSGSSFVPFVPFPHDYFAKDKKQAEGTHPGEVITHQTTPPVSGQDHPVEQTTGSPLNTTMQSQGTSFKPPVGSSNSQGEYKQNESGDRRRSLEGSAVQEACDPLDMSEEAKAQRWFRRVAQIKDISELSEIPDEDFPSIMPMRKGVNRFVVSKRKTPLERRLTSSQYRKNLPTVTSSSSDHVVTKNEENNGS